MLVLATLRPPFWSIHQTQQDVQVKSLSQGLSEVVNQPFLCGTQLWVANVLTSHMTGQIYFNGLGGGE